LQQIAANRQIIGRRPAVKSPRWYPTENIIAEISGSNADSMGKIGLWLRKCAAKRCKTTILPFSAAFAAARSIDFQQ
jgi:hypothetical protein